jgi:hypothetical protein
VIGAITGGLVGLPFGIIVGGAVGMYAGFFRASAAPASRAGRSVKADEAKGMEKTVLMRDKMEKTVVMRGDLEKTVVTRPDLEKTVVTRTDLEKTVVARTNLEKTAVTRPKQGPPDAAAAEALKRKRDLTAMKKKES